MLVQAASYVLLPSPHPTSFYVFGLPCAFLALTWNQQFLQRAPEWGMGFRNQDLGSICAYCFKFFLRRENYSIQRQCIGFYQRLASYSKVINHRQHVNSGTVTILGNRIAASTFLGIVSTVQMSYPLLISSFAIFFVNKLTECYLNKYRIKFLSIN